MQATAGIANVHLDKKDGKPAVSLDLSRNGSRSTFGEVRVLKAGVKAPIALQKGVAIYTEVNSRHVAIPVDPDFKGAVAGPGDRPICRDLRRRHAHDRRNPGGAPLRRERRRRASSMLGRRNWLRKAAMSLALCAGGVAASAPPPDAPRPWTADPDDQFLLDVNIRQLRLGDGVRAYNTPEALVSS